MRCAPKWNDLDPDMKQALTVIADKIARILNGDPFYVDNWHDIQGYAKLIEDRINMIADTDNSLYDLVDEEAVEEVYEYKQEKDGQWVRQPQQKYILMNDGNQGQYNGNPG